MPNKWTQHVQQYRQQHPDKSYKQCLQDAGMVLLVLGHPKNL